MKKTGIWLDKEKAIIITINGDNISLEKIVSGVETFRVHGGSGSKMKGGPQDVVQDRKFMEREKHQLKDYFSRLVKKVKTTDALALFGPAETYKKFEQELKTNFPVLNLKVKGVTNSDSMTDNQVKSLVINFFNGS